MKVPVLCFLTNLVHVCSNVVYGEKHANNYNKHRNTKQKLVLDSSLFSLAEQTIGPKNNTFP